MKGAIAPGDPCAVGLGFIWSSYSLTVRVCDGKAASPEKITGIAGVGELVEINGCIDGDLKKSGQ